MKRKTLLCLAALLLLCAACKKSKIENDSGSETSGFRASLEVPTNEDKTYLDGLQVKWEENDQIKIFGGEIRKDGDRPFVHVSGSTPQEFTATNISQNGLYTEFEGKDDFNYDGYLACYPKNLIQKDGDDGVKKITFPQQQTYKEGTFDKDCFPMVAQSDNKYLQFNNLCGILAINLTGESTQKVKEIKITSKKVNDILCGTAICVILDYFPLYMSYNSWENTQNNITLKCNTPVALSETPTMFYFVILPNTLQNGFYMEITLENNEKWEFSATKNTEINQNKIRQMPALNLKEEVIEDDRYPNGLPGEFSVSPTKKVCFSQGNLQFQTNENEEKWQFAPNQWVICDHVGTNYSENSGAWIDLFGWGTSNYNYGPICYQPWSTDGDNTKYGPNPEGEEKNLSVTTESDWGCNTIKNSEIGGWHTLTMVEWMYLIGFEKTLTGGKPHNTHRVNYDRLYGEGKILNAGTEYKGLIILPDNWECPSGITFNPKATEYSNTYTMRQWMTMEAAGAVFLPETKYRIGQTFIENTANYWTSSYGNEAWPYDDGGYFLSYSTTTGYSSSCYIYFNGSPNGGSDLPYIISFSRQLRNYGGAVRLVREVKEELN